MIPTGSYEPARCPWCHDVLLDTCLEMVSARVAAWHAHKPKCPNPPQDEAEEDEGYGVAAWVRQLR